MLHMVIREHLDDFLRTAANQADGAGLPEFIVREFEIWLRWTNTMSSSAVQRWSEMETDRVYGTLAAAMSRVQAPRA